MTTMCSECHCYFETDNPKANNCPPCNYYLRLSPEERFKQGPPQTFLGVSYRDETGGDNPEYKKRIEGEVYDGVDNEFETVTISPVEERVKAWQKLNNKQTANHLLTLIRTFKQNWEDKYHV